MNPVLHDHLMSVASEEKPPIVILNVIVAEADGLEAKDVNGLSDPYCMLGKLSKNKSLMSLSFLYLNKLNIV